MFSPFLNPPLGPSVRDRCGPTDLPHLSPRRQCSAAYLPVIRIGNSGSLSLNASMYDESPPSVPRPATRPFPGSPASIAMAFTALDQSLWYLGLGLKSSPAHAFAYEKNTTSVKLRV